MSGLLSSSHTPFPPDAIAVISRPARAATTSGKARTRDWILRFERRTPPRIEPLMGWTGGDDTLAQVELRFPSAQAAMAYARRQGLAFEVKGNARPTLRLVSDTSAPQDARRRRLQWVERTLGPKLAGRDDEPALAHRVPREVLNDPNLTREAKHEMLQRLAVDAYREETAGHASPSRLDAVIDALLDLEAEATRSPAPARAA